MKLLAFAASSSKNSINKHLVTYAATLLPEAQTEILDLNDFELPLFSVDREKELGQPELARQFLEKIAHSDALIISYAEHNGSYTAAYKNLFDWCSRIDVKVFQNKPVIALATSPGARGASSVLQTATQSLPRFGADLKGSLSIPKFQENFNTQENKLSNPELDQQLKTLIKNLR